MKKTAVRSYKKEGAFHSHFIKRSSLQATRNKRLQMSVEWGGRKPVSVSVGGRFLATGAATEIGLSPIFSLVLCTTKLHIARVRVYDTNDKWPVTRVPGTDFGS